MFVCSLLDISGFEIKYKMLETMGIIESAHGLDGAMLYYDKSQNMENYTSNVESWINFIFV